MRGTTTEAQWNQSFVWCQIRIHCASLKIGTGFFLAVCLLASAAHAGLGPENVAVILNAESESSRRIAAEYVAL